MSNEREADTDSTEVKDGREQAVSVTARPNPPGTSAAGAADAIDPVTEASEESFPASDAPAWTALAVGKRAGPKSKES